jgi:Trypsin-like peptidase domain
VEVRTGQQTFATFAIGAIATAATIGALPAGIATPSTTEVHASARSVRDATVAPMSDRAHAGPRVLTTDVADFVVRVRGGATCSGTPITGTTYVVTAAHCVLDRNGEVSTRTVLRDGEEYKAVAVIVDPAYHDSPVPRLDAAVLVFDGTIPGTSATIGEQLPTAGSVVLAGFQPLDTDGSLLRGTSYTDHPHPRGVTGGVIAIETEVAGCVRPASELRITITEVKVSCGLVPGASGGGMLVEGPSGPVLVGIISTVSYDLTDNGIVPLPALHELLERASEFTYASLEQATPSKPITRS